MDLYFSPMACSLATRIALYEAGADARFIEVDPLTKRTLPDGADFREVYPLGLVPAVRTDDGEVLAENAAVLQFVADTYPDAELAPTEPRERARLHQWLCFIGTELHKGLFAPQFDKSAPPEARRWALDKAAARLSVLERHLASGRPFLLDRFTVADAYLTTVLNWTQATPVDLTPFPALVAYQKRMRQRPSVARALGIEFPLYQAELARHQSAEMSSTPASTATSSTADSAIR